MPHGNFVSRSKATRGARRGASLRLFEGARELKPAHALHGEIRQQGAGRFSHWGEWLYFSTSDGTDPRHNGRTYPLTATATLDAKLLIALALLDLIAFAAIHGAHSPLRSERGPRRARRRCCPDPVAARARRAESTAFGLAWLCGLTYRTND